MKIGSRQFYRPEIFFALIIFLFCQFSPEEIRAFPLSTAEEKKIGEKFLTNIRKHFDFLDDDFANKYINDLGHYLIAQLNQGRYGEEQVLSPETVALMHQPAIETDFEGVSYAFGWRTGLVEGEPTVRHGGDVSNYHSNMAFSPTRGWGVAIVMNAAGLLQGAALNEPVNEVLRLSSGYDAGQPIQDSAPAFIVLWGIAILSTVLNLVSWGISYRRLMNKGGQLGLVRYLLLPLGVNLVPMWIMFIGFPSLGNSIWPAMPLFAPDTALIFLVSAAVIVLTMLARVVVYFRFASRTGSSSY